MSENLAFANISEFDETLDRDLSAGMGYLAVSGDIVEAVDSVYDEIAEQSITELEEDFTDIEEKQEVVQIETARKFDNQARDAIVIGIVERYKSHPLFIKATQSLWNPEIPSMHRDLQYDVLTPKREVELFKQLDAGVEAVESNPETADEDTLLAAAIARETLYLSNLRLVATINLKTYKGGKIALEDYFDEGGIGLSKAISRFDYKRGYKFSTYATPWIKQAILRHKIDQDDTIRVAANAKERATKIIKCYEETKIQLNREPKLEEISDETGYSADIVAEVLRTATYRETLSTDVPISDEMTELAIIDGVQSDEKLEAEVVQDVHAEALIEAIFELNQIDRVSQYVLSFRFGIVVDKLRGTSIESKSGKITYEFLLDRLDGIDHVTLGDIGDLFGLTRERIRQIEAKALAILRSSEKIQSLYASSEY